MGGDGEVGTAVVPLLLTPHTTLLTCPASPAAHTAPPHCVHAGRPPAGAHRASLAPWGAPKQRPPWAAPHSPGARCRGFTGVSCPSSPSLHPQEPSCCSHLGAIGGSPAILSHCCKDKQTEGMGRGAVGPRRAPQTHHTDGTAPRQRGKRRQGVWPSVLRWGVAPNARGRVPLQQEKTLQ